MTIQELSQNLCSLQDALEASDDPNSASSLALRILSLKLQQQLIVAAFDPLKSLDGVSVADVGTLEKLIPEAQAAIEDGKSQVDLVNKIVATATIALRAAGLPL